MKKGTLSAGVDIIFFLLAAGVLLFIFTPVSQYIMGKSNEEICRASVGAASTLRLAGQSFSGIECPANKIEIERGDVYEDGEVSEEKVKELFAEEMRLCWWKMGEGELEMFSDEQLVTRKNICVVCSKIQADERVLEEIRTVEGFEEYLNDTSLPDNEGLTYSDYMSLDEESVIEVQDSLDLSEQKLVVFMFLTKPMASDIPGLGKLSELVGIKTLSSIFLIDQNEINTLECDDVYQ